MSQRHGKRSEAPKYSNDTSLTTYIGGTYSFMSLKISTIAL